MLPDVVRIVIWAPPSFYFCMYSERGARRFALLLSLKVPDFDDTATLKLLFFGTNIWISPLVVLICDFADIMFLKSKEISPIVEPAVKYSVSIL